MSKVQTVKFLFALWLVLFAGSLAWRFHGGAGAALDIAVERGIALVIGQVLAAGAAVMCWNATKALPRGSGAIRWLGHLPIAVTLLVCAYVAWTIAAAFGRGMA